MHQGLAAYRATGAEIGGRDFLALLAEAYTRGGQAEDGLRTARRGAGRRGQQVGSATMRRRCIALTGGAAAAAGCPGRGPGGNLLPASPHHRPPPAGQVLGAAGRHEPESSVAAAGQARRSPRRCWRRSTAGSPRALTPPICKRRRHCLMRSGEVEAPGLTSVTCDATRYCGNWTSVSTSPRTAAKSGAVAGTIWLSLPVCL